MGPELPWLISRGGGWADWRDGEIFKRNDGPGRGGTSAENRKSVLMNTFGLTSQERSGFLLVLEWFENFRLRHELAAGREAARAFWKTEVLREGCTRGCFTVTGLSNR